MDLATEADIDGAATDLAYECHRAAASWWVDMKTGKHYNSWTEAEQRAFIAEKLLLVHSEISEAVEGRRKNLADDKLPQYPMFQVELADALIRIFDLCGALHIPIGSIMVDKMKFNAQREDHKHEQRQAAGGKSV